MHQLRGRRSGCAFFASTTGKGSCHRPEAGVRSSAPSKISTSINRQRQDFRVTTELSECLTSGGFASEGSAVVRVQGLTPNSLHHNAALHHTHPRFSEPLHLKSRTSRAQRSGCTFCPPGRWQDRPKFCRSSPSTADSNTPLISECSAGPKGPTPPSELHEDNLASGGQKIQMQK